MTDTVTEAPVTPVTPETEQTPVEPEVPQVKVEDLDPFLQTLLSKVGADVLAYNQVVGILKANFGDMVSAREAIYASDDPKMVEYAEAIESLNKQLEALETEREQIADSQFAESREQNKDQLDELTNSADTLEKKIRSARKFIQDETGEDAPVVLSLLPDIASRKGRSTIGGSGRGKDGRKLRGFEIHVNGEIALAKNSKGKLVSSFSAAATKCGVSTQVLQQAYMEKVGTTDADKFPEGPVEFTVTDGEGDKAKSYNIRAVRLTTEQTP